MKKKILTFIVIIIAIHLLGGALLYSKTLRSAKTKEIATEKYQNDNEKMMGEKLGNVQISSETYEIDTTNRIISKISAETSKDLFIDNISVSGAYVILDENENSMEEGIIKTGYKIRTDDGLYTLSVLGDIAPDGKVNISDLARLRSHLVQEDGKILEGAPLASADITGEGTINILDLTRLRAILVGK